MVLRLTVTKPYGFGGFRSHVWAFQPTRRQSVIGDKWVSRLNEGQNSSFELNKAVEFKPVVKDDNVQPSLLEKRWILIWLPTVGLPSPK